MFARHGERGIARLEPDGRVTVLADRYRGRRLNSPNDLVFHSNGDLYFTDPPFGLPKSYDDPGKELPHQGVYRLARDGSLTLLTSELSAPNGLAFSPDERTLYVSNADARRLVWTAFAGPRRTARSARAGPSSTGPPPSPAGAEPLTV